MTLRKSTERQIKKKDQHIELVEHEQHSQLLVYVERCIEKADEREINRLNKMKVPFRGMCELLASLDLSEEDRHKCNTWVSDYGNQISEVVEPFSHTLFIRQYESGPLLTALKELTTLYSNSEFTIHYRNDIEQEDLHLPSETQAILLRLIFSMLKASTNHVGSQEVWLDITQDQSRLRVHYMDEQADFQASYFEDMHFFATCLNPLYPLQQTDGVIRIDIPFPQPQTEKTSS